MSEQKFKIGDRVRACPGAPGGGKSGVLVPPTTFSTIVPYRIRFDDGGECPLRADEIELVTPKFAFQVGDKVRTANYTPERFVTIEWVGDKTFAGTDEKGERKMYDHNSPTSRWLPWVKTYHFPFKVGDRVRLSNGSWSKGLTIHTIPEPTLDWWEDIDGYRYKKESSILGDLWELAPKPKHPFKVGDLVRNSNNIYPWPVTVTKVWFDGDRPLMSCNKDRTGADRAYSWTHTPADIWQKWVVPEPVKPPVIKRWLVTTEERLAVTGEAFIVGGDTPIEVAMINFGHARHPVITSVQPLTNLNDWIVGGDGK